MNKPIIVFTLLICCIFSNSVKGLNKYSDLKLNKDNHRKIQVFTYINLFPMIVLKC